VNKKKLTTILVAFVTLSKLSTLFTIPAVILNTAILTNPAFALGNEKPGEDGGGGIDTSGRKKPAPSTPSAPSTNYYPPAIKFLLNNSSSIEQISKTVWNEGGKGIAEQKVKEALNGKQIRDGVSIYNTTVNLAGIRQTQVAPGSNDTQANVKIIVPANNSEFTTTTPTIFGSYADPSFRLDFDLEVNLKISAIANKIQIDDVSIKVSNASIRGSNVVGSFLQAFIDFFTGGQFSRDIISRINGDYSVKEQLAMGIQSAIDRYVPAGVLVDPRIRIMRNGSNIPFINLGK
jgi:hypothetical protein